MDAVTRRIFAAQCIAISSGEAQMARRRS